MNSRVQGVEERIDFEVARNQNLAMEDYAGLRRQGIEVGDDNDISPEINPKRITQQQLLRKH